jgi:putative FmdB family regulatory protein
LPLYEYCCHQCGFRYEKIQKFDAEPEVTCPKCGGALYRPLTAPALQFKGAGWYVNDYAPKGTASAGGAPAGDAPAADAAKTGGGEKPASADTKSAGESKSTSESKPAASDSTSKPAAAPSK